MQNSFVLAAWAFAAGALIPVMGSWNAGLSRAAGNAPVAVLILFVVALSGAAAVLVLSGGGLPDWGRLASAPPQLFLGGLIVIFYVWSVTLLVPRFGVGNTILFAVTAQLLMSALLDHFGLFGLPVRPVSLARLGGLALMLVGLTIAQLSVDRGT